MTRRNRRLAAGAVLVAVAAAAGWGLSVAASRAHRAAAATGDL